MWVLRGLRDGVVSTRWPGRPDPYADSARGPATVVGQPAGDQEDLGRLCPTGAITVAGRRVALDQGRCVQCGWCVAARPEVFGWAAGPATATLTRPALVVPERREDPAALAALRADLRARTSALRRSVHLRHVDAGSDGTEEWEILALLNPVYDVHRLGIFFTASPRHADVLLVTGAGARCMTEPLRQTYQAMPHPKVVVAVGTDAVSGGLVGGGGAGGGDGAGGDGAGHGDAVTGGVSGTLPVDVWVPGSPPNPFCILSGLLLAMGRLR